MNPSLIFTALSAPFNPERVSWRVGSTNKDKTEAQALAYIDARDVYDRLDSVVGPDKWQCRYPHADKKTVCEISIKIGDEWISKANGAGDSDIEAEKGALSDALKRAAVAWGVGRYLYDLKSPWVEIEPWGKSYRIKKSEEPKLQQILRNYVAPKAEPTLAEKVQAANTQAKLFVETKPTEPEALAKFLKENSARLARCAVYPEARTILENAGLLVLAKAENQ